MLAHTSGADIKIHGNAPSYHFQLTKDRKKLSFTVLASKAVATEDVTDGEAASALFRAPACCSCT